MDLTSTSIRDGEAIGADYALAQPAADGHVSFAGNKNPHLAWTDPPAGAQSFVVTCVDIDAPSVGDDVNQEDREVPADLERAEFTHWLLVNIPADITQIAEASHSQSVVPRGKSADAAPVGLHGQNDYTAWFAGDSDLDGSWNGYDGCAPPWNDSVPHRYRFTVSALDIAELDLPAGFSRSEMVSAMAGHVLDSASITGWYATNPRLR